MEDGGMGEHMNIIPAFSTPVLALSDCPKCNGTGFIPGPKASSVYECDCVYLAKARRYLTTIYEDAQFKDLDIGTCDKRNLLLVEILQPTFKKFVKSFLLSTYTTKKYIHKTVSGLEVIDAYVYGMFGEEGGGRIDGPYNDLKMVDLLILYLMKDPPNKHYDNILISLIRDRNLQKRMTWVYSIYSLKNPSFYRTYGQAFVDFLNDESDSKMLTIKLPKNY
jgi:hypothetical protein